MPHVGAWDDQKVQEQLLTAVFIKDVANLVFLATVAVNGRLSNACRISSDFFSESDTYWQGTFAAEFSRLSPDFYELPIGKTTSNARKQTPRGFIRRHFLDIHERMREIEAKASEFYKTLETKGVQLQDALSNLDVLRLLLNSATEGSERRALTTEVFRAEEQLVIIEGLLDSTVQDLNDFAQKVNEELRRFENIQPQCGYLRSAQTKAGNLFVKMSLNNLEDLGVDFRYLGDGVVRYSKLPVEAAPNLAWEKVGLLPDAASSLVAVLQTGKLASLIVDKPAIVQTLTGRFVYVQGGVTKAFGQTMVGISALSTLMDLAIINKKFDQRDAFHALVQSVLRISESVYTEFFYDRINNQYKQSKWLAAAVDVTQFAVTTALAVSAGSAIGILTNVAWEVLEEYTFDKWIHEKLEGDLKDAIGESMEEYLKADKNNTWSPLPNYGLK